MKSKKLNVSSTSNIIMGGVFKVFVRPLCGRFTSKEKRNPINNLFWFSTPPKIWTFVPIFSGDVERNNEEKSTIACWDSNPNPHNPNSNPLTLELPPNALMFAVSCSFSVCSWSAQINGGSSKSKFVFKDKTSFYHFKPQKIQNTLI